MVTEVRPVQWWLKQYLSGALGADEIPPAVLSWSRFFIFEGAREIVLMDTKEERAAELLKVPQRVRGLVGEEVIRLWGMRGNL